MHRWMPFGFSGIQLRWMLWLWTLLATLATAAAKSKQFSRGQLIHLDVQYVPRKYIIPQLAERESSV